MRYQRPIPRRTISKEFEEGVYQAKIVSVRREKSKKKQDMFVLTLEGVQGERVSYFLTFGTVYTQSNMNYLLASIESNKVEIPDISYGFNRQTYEFLKGKQVYIKIEMKKYKGVTKPQVESFLMREEYEEKEFL
ncbi:type III secretion system protein PrgE [Vagococcus teuberi]